MPLCVLANTTQLSNSTNIFNLIPANMTNLNQTSPMTFTLNTNGYSGAPLGNYIACSSNGQYVTIACDLAIYVSTNYGASFTKNTFTDYMYAVAMSSTGQYQLVITNGNNNIGYYKSSNYGTSWTNYNVFNGPNLGRFLQCVCMSSNGKYQYIGGGGGSGWSSFYSTDFGSTFTSFGAITNRVSCTINDSTSQVITYQLTNTSCGFYTVTLSSTPPLTETLMTYSFSDTNYIQYEPMTSNGNNIVLVNNTANNFYYSSDYGQNFSTYSTVINSTNIYVKFICYNSNNYLVASDGTKIYLSLTNSSTWQYFNPNFANTICSICVSKNSPYIYILLDNGNLYKTIV